MLYLLRCLQGRDDGETEKFLLSMFADCPKILAIKAESPRVSETVAPDEIEEALERVIECLHVPQTGVAWRRGEDYEYGRLPRQPEDRLREAEARILALKIAAECDGNTASTEYIKKRVPELIPLTEKDLQKSSSRPRENLWQQIVGNVISHKPGNRSIFNQGYAERTFDGLRVTIQGMNYLKSMGFLAS